VFNLKEKCSFAIEISIAKLKVDGLKPTRVKIQRQGISGSFAGGTHFRLDLEGPNKILAGTV